MAGCCRRPPSQQRKEYFQGIDSVQGDSWALGEGRDCIAPILLKSAFSLLRRIEMGFGRGRGAEVILGLEFSKASEVTEVMCQQQVRIHQQRQHKFIYILLLPAQDGAIFLVDKCNLKCFTYNLLILETQ